MDPVEAHAKGVVDAVVEGPASEGAVAMLKPLRTLPIAALRAVKAQVVGADDPKVQADRFAEVWGGLEHRAALAGLLGGFRPK